jgi:hypothetical protein
MKKLIFLFLIVITSISCGSNELDPCQISIDFIKDDLHNPSTIDYSSFDCSKEFDNINKYTILRKISAQNSFGVKKEYVYKLELKYLGGNQYDKSSWELISIKSEEYR